MFDLERLIEAVALIDIDAAIILGTSEEDPCFAYLYTGEHLYRNKKASKVLIQAFNFNNTPQGEDFWTSIYNRLVQKES